jgi:hypothetical protein
MRIDQIFPVAQEIVVLMPDGSPTDMKLKLVGTDSKVFSTLIHEQLQRRVGRTDALSIQERNRESQEQAAAVIVGWSGLEDENGPIPYSKEKAIELMATPEYAFIREQVEGFAAKRTNFFRSGQQPAK